MNPGLRPLVNPPIVLGPPGASPIPLANFAPPVILLGSEFDSSGPTDGVLQVETATAAGTATATGTAIVTVTSALFDEPRVINIAVTNTDTATILGGKIRTALAADPVVSSHYTVGGATTTATLTARSSAANDATLNIAIATGSATGVTAVPTSANTTAGVAGIAGILGQEATNGTGTFWKLTIADPPTWSVMDFS